MSAADRPATAPRPAARPTSVMAEPWDEERQGIDDLGQHLSAPHLKRRSSSRKREQDARSRSTRYIAVTTR